MTCGWPGCPHEVRFGYCRHHWDRMPHRIRDTTKEEREQWIRDDMATVDAIPLRLALAAYLATQDIKLVHCWQTLGRWNAMMEFPCTTGVGSTMLEAVLDGIERLGHGGFGLRLFLLDYVVSDLERRIR